MDCQGLGFSLFRPGYVWVLQQNLALYVVPYHALHTCVSYLHLLTAALHCGELVRAAPRGIRFVHLLTPFYKRFPTKELLSQVS
jgi:hypothetical protein